MATCICDYFGDTFQYNWSLFSVFDLQFEKSEIQIVELHVFLKMYLNILYNDEKPQTIWQQQYYSVNIS